MNTTNCIRALLVEDDRAQASLYATILNKAFGSEIELSVLHDSLDAAKYLQSQQTEILITELSMPVLDGVELARRAKDRYRGTQVLMLTAASTPDHLSEAAKAAASDYLLKPFSDSLLIILVEQARARLHRWRNALSETLCQKANWR